MQQFDTNYFVNEVTSKLEDHSSKFIVNNEKIESLKETISKQEIVLKNLETQFSVLNERNNYLENRNSLLENRLYDLNKMMMKHFAYKKPPTEIVPAVPVVPPVKTPDIVFPGLKPF